MSDFKCNTILQGNLLKRRAEPMSIVDFIAVVSFGLTCFSIGYTFGKDKHKNNRPSLAN